MLLAKSVGKLTPDKKYLKNEEYQNLGRFLGFCYSCKYSIANAFEQSFYQAICKLSKNEFDKLKEQKAYFFDLYLQMYPKDQFAKFMAETSQFCESLSQPDISRVKKELDYITLLNEGEMIDIDSFQNELSEMIFCIKSLVNKQSTCTVDDYNQYLELKNNLTPILLKSIGAQFGNEISKRKVKGGIVLQIFCGLFLEIGHTRWKEISKDWKLFQSKLEGSIDRFAITSTIRFRDGYSEEMKNTVYKWIESAEDEKVRDLLQFATGARSINHKSEFSLKFGISSKNKISATACSRVIYLPNNTNAENIFEMLDACTGNCTYNKV